MTKGKAKTFANYLDERLDASETQRLKKAAEDENRYFSYLKEELSNILQSYMSKHGLKMCDMASILCWSDARLARILKGGHGFSMSSIAHIGAACRLRPRLVFVEEERKDKKIEKSVD